MALINNSDLKRELIEGAKINISKEDVPSALAEKVVPVMEVNPKLLRVANIVRNTTSFAANVYTTPANKDFYLVSAYGQVSGDGVSSGGRIITVTIDGAAQILLQILQQDIAGSSGSVSLNPSIPILLDRNTNIAITGANPRGSVGIIGYIVED